MVNRTRNRLTRKASSNAAMENQKAEERLREQHSRLLCNHMPAICHSIDRNGRIIAVSDKWLDEFGYERSEVIGRTSVEFLTSRSRTDAETLALPAFWSTGSACDVSYQIVRKNGEIVDVLLSAIAERDEDGEFKRSLAILRVVTDRERLQESREGKVERRVLRRNPYGLTNRELVVLDLVATGKADKEIAAQLVISPLTVQKHVSNILAKMGAGSRTEAAVRAVQEVPLWLTGG